MAGEARSTEFLLSTATVMIGPQAKVMELTPEDHSLGLVKNVQATVDIGFTELGQGLNNQIVSSVNTNLSTKISAELYEFSARNMAYGAMLDGSDEAFEPNPTEYALGSAVTGGEATGASVPLTASSGANFTPGDFVVLQDLNRPDKVHVGKVASVETDTLTLATGFIVPTGVDFAVASTKVFRVAAIKIGQVPNAPVYGMKLVGIMPEGGAPVTLIFPKIRITRGISLAFQQDQFSNMPFEFTPYALIASDPYYSDFGSLKTWMVLKNK